MVAPLGVKKLDLTGLLNTRGVKVEEMLWPFSAQMRQWELEEDAALPLPEGKGCELGWK